MYRFNYDRYSSVNRTFYQSYQRFCFAVSFAILLICQYLVMSQSLEQTPKKKSKLVSTSKLALFFAYCGAGIAGFGYFSFKCIQIRNEYENQSNYARGRIYQSPAFKKMIVTGVGMTFGFIAGMAYLIKTIKPADLLLKQATQMSKLYSDDMRIDPIYQDYHIFQTMEYFRVSKELIQKTQQEFRQIQKNLRVQGKYLKPEQSSFQKQLIKLVLKKQQAFGFIK